MVYLTKILCNLVKKTVHRRTGTFIDSLRLHVSGGHGGNGLPKYGGVGGQGGCVYFVAKDGVTLKKLQHKYFKKRIKASAGEDSSKYQILGRRGTDERVEVPIGIQILDENLRVVHELNEEGADYLVARGGIGGSSGTNFLGKPGDTKFISLDLKLIADVGLIGFPNAGKSTTLKAISRASPKIASYPFTTIRPQIGVVEYQDYRTISIADLPGLIEGAHKNIGMGHKFLKHVERTRLLLMIIDIFGFQLSNLRVKRSGLETIYALNKELEMYDDNLLNTPCVLLLNKIDLPGAQEEMEKIMHVVNNLNSGLDHCPIELRPEKLIKFEEIIQISAKNSINIDLVKTKLREVLNEVAIRKLEQENRDKFNDIVEGKIQERGPKIT